MKKSRKILLLIGGALLTSAMLLGGHGSVEASSQWYTDEDGRCTTVCEGAPLADCPC